MHFPETGRGFAIEHIAQNIEMGVPATGHTQALVRVSEAAMGDGQFDLVLLWRHTGTFDLEDRSGRASARSVGAPRWRQLAHVCPNFFTRLSPPTIRDARYRWRPEFVLSAGS
mgnify:CR=1 FL=1